MKILAIRGRNLASLEEPEGCRFSGSDRLDKSGRREIPVDGYVAGRYLRLVGRRTECNGCLAVS